MPALATDIMKNPSAPNVLMSSYDICWPVMQGSQCQHSNFTHAYNSSTSYRHNWTTLYGSTSERLCLSVSTPMNLIFSKVVFSSFLFQNNPLVLVGFYQNFYHHASNAKFSISHPFFVWKICRTWHNVFFWISLVKKCTQSFPQCYIKRRKVTSWRLLVTPLAADSPLHCKSSKSQVFVCKPLYTKDINCTRTSNREAGTQIFNYESTRWWPQFEPKRDNLRYYAHGQLCLEQAKLPIAWG
jgi:hypothetical protein